jgi:predicted nucleotidyltransferase
MTSDSALSDSKPLWAITPEKIAEAVRRIVAAASPVRIILFGSAARGDTGRDSDIDLIVVERDVRDRYAETVRLHRALRGLILPVDILVIADRDFQEWADTPGSVYQTANEEGRVLYEAA